MAYPTTIDVYITLVDNIDTVAASHVNERNTAIVNIETALQANLAGVNIIGDIRMWAGAIADIPSGWLFCNGATVNIQDYPDLAEAIGGQFGTMTATMTDSSSYAHTITANGDASLSYLSSRFGNASALFDGSGDYLTVPDHAIWDLGTGDFTIEMWINNASAGWSTQFYLEITGTTKVQFYHVAGDGFKVVIGGTTHTFSYSGSSWGVGGMIHVACMRTSGTVTAHIDGYQVVSGAADSTNITSNTGVRIGRDSGGSWNFNGHMDEIRISNVARYSGNPFTVPSAAFTSDANTLLLLHNDVTTGTFVLPDFRDRFPIGAKQDSGGISKSNITGSLAKTGGSITSNSGGGGEASNGGGNGDIGSHVHTMSPPYVAFAFMVKT